MMSKECREDYKKEGRRGGALVVGEEEGVSVRYGERWLYLVPNFPTVERPTILLVKVCVCVPSWIIKVSGKAKEELSCVKYNTWSLVGWPDARIVSKTAVFGVKIEKILNLRRK